MKASNLLGHKNQFIINDWCAYYFQSYDTMLCKVIQGDLGDNLIMLNNYWSVTTGKHMRAFLEETRMLDTVLDLILKYKLFRNFKDFMERANIVKVHKDIITVDYTNEKGEFVVYTCL